MNSVELIKYYRSQEFKEQYLYEGTDLGVTCQEDETVFKIWSPMASGVWLNLYQNGEGAAYTQIAMEQQKQGVWEYRQNGNMHGIYYDYCIEHDGERVSTADPYAKACGCNGIRSMVVDLSKTNPEGWEQDQAPARKPENIIYEMHVKDFSYDPSSGVPEEYRGKYRGFALEGTTLNQDGVHPTCLDYVADLGITHVQLMPVYDYGSVDEAGDASLFNWGYDPWNYNAPEGSYSLDPNHGEVRIRELKELVMALHKKGLRVNMDVVYNHTFNADSWLSRTVPYYYYRINEDGSYSDGSACGNDVATEREMCGKYILESVLYWCREFHLDGFRFDLMGLMNVDLLNRIREALDREYGKGEKMLYGEPWSGGPTAMEEGFYPCLKANLKYLDEEVGAFCDNTRDAIKGHVFYEEVPGFVNGGKYLEEDILQSVKAWCGTKDGFAKAPSQVLSYVSAHDNLTLWDKLVITLNQEVEDQADKKPEFSSSTPEESVEAYERPDNLSAIKEKLDYEAMDKDVLRANKMAAAVTFTCQGNLFFLGGEEHGRTKLGDENSFQSSAEINRIDWNRVYEYEELVEYYRGLLRFRQLQPGLCDKTSHAGERIFKETILEDGLLHFSVENDADSPWKTLFIIYNNNKEEKTVKLPAGNWELLVDGESSRLWEAAKRTICSKKTNIMPVSVMILGKCK